MADKNKQKDELNIDELSFEGAINKLTEIVSDIETGETSLQESIGQYEKGMKLIKHCRGILNDAEKKIEDISGNVLDDEERGD
jgi:exodeoxyribonuclease VII small subunit